MGWKVINSVWAFKRKIYTGVSLKNHKASLCVRRDLKTDGVDYFDKYSPAVQGSTVHLLLIATCILNLETKQVDLLLILFIQKLNQIISLKR